MKKLILTSLFGTAMAVSAFAQSATTTATSTASTTQPVATTTQVACVTNAVEKREDAIIAAHDIYHTAIKNALMARKAGLKSALALIDVNAREVARKATQNTFASSSRAAEKSFKLAKDTAQNTFKSELRLCGLGNDFKSTSAATSTKNRDDDDHDSREARNQDKFLKKFLLSKEYKKFEKYFMNF